MQTNAHRQRIDALHSLATRLLGSTSQGLLADALDHLFGPTSARSGLAVLAGAKLTIVAEHGLSTPGDAGSVRDAINAIAERAIEDGRTLRALDVRHDRIGIPGVGEIAATGCTGAVAVPLLFRERVLGCFVLLFPSNSTIDEETTLFVESVAALVAPTVAAQLGPTGRTSIPAGTGGVGPTPPMGMTLLGESVAHELEGPVAALSMQLDEQRRIVADLQVFSDGADTPLGGAIAELAELTDELYATISRLHDTTEQLTRLGAREIEPAVIDLAEVARSACLVARASFEERGVLLETQLTNGCYVSGHRESLLHVASDLLILARDRAEHVRGAQKVMVRAANQGSRVVLSVSEIVLPVDDGSEVRESERRPLAEALSDERPRLLLKLLSDVVLAHGGHVETLPVAPNGTLYRVTLPAFGAQEHSLFGRADAQSKAKEDAAVRQVLVVDDDPVFSRAARRALRPHHVREANTASEAEILLHDLAYVPDLVICDLMLPGADGTTLHRRILDSRPEIASLFLFVTGGALGRETADYIRASGCGALKKPIDLSAVRRHLSNPHRNTATTSIVRTLRQELEDG